MEDFPKPRIKARFGRPPRTFKKKRSIRVFSCTGHLGACPEIIRAKMSNAGDIYLFPLVAFGNDFHLSYHKSGTFHWAFDGKHEVPVCGENDFNAAFKMMLRVNKNPCYCIRLGKALDVDEIEKVLKIAEIYLPFEFSVEDIAAKLDSDKFCIFRSGTIPERTGLLGRLKDVINKTIKCGICLRIPGSAPLPKL